VPFIGFWQRWRRRLQQEPRNPAPNLRETEQQRDAARRQAAKELGAIVAAAWENSDVAEGDPTCLDNCIYIRIW
jgi:hypothetical protein